MKSVQFGGVPVGPENPPYIIAEIGSNHNGDMDLCRQLIDAAADAGAHAVKFQSWTENSLIAKEEYDRNSEYSDKKRHFGTLKEMVKAYQFTTEQHMEAHSYCGERGIAFCSTPFSPDEADLLEKLDVPFYKIASMDIVHLPLLRHVARKQRPMLISTGMATLAEIEKAVETVRGEGNDQIVLLHCISIYPPDYDMIQLRNMATLQQAFDVPVGFSDHTMGTAIPLAAIALGACVIEKHFTLDQDMPGWDHAISATPAELRTIVAEGRNIQTSLGGSSRIVTEAEIEKRKKFRRSLVTRRPLSRGHVLTEADLDAKRPGTGISPAEISYALGRTLARDLQEDQVIRWEDLG
jgi:N,N'-diacetyllegionaminate synthase